MTSVELEQSGGVCLIRLDRPKARNAIDPAMLDQLHQAVDTATASGATAVVVTGQPSYFGAGADIHQYVAGDLHPLEEFTRRAGALCTRLRTLGAPVVAAVEGYALGGGFEIVLSCDLVVASTEASFGLPELRLGLLPGWGGTQRLTELVGRTRAGHVILAGHRITADEAYAWGVVGQLSQPGQALADAMKLATALAAGPRPATALVKRAIAAAQTTARAPGLDLEVESLLRTFGSEDGREGVRAFAERRAPQFALGAP